MTNTIRTLVAREEELRATLTLENVRLEAARIDLERTKIVAPFDGVVSALNVEQNQYVGTGGVILRLDSVDVAEISTQFNEIAFSRLLRSGVSEQTQHPRLSSVNIRTRLNNSQTSHVWTGEFARYSDTFDRRTGTLGAVIFVNDPLANPRTPLRKGLFAEVELLGEPIADSLVVPRAAVTEGRVLVANDDNRLELRDVVVDFRQEDFAVITRGLFAGERLVISQPPMIISGMLLNAVAAPGVEKRIADQATGINQITDASDSPVRNTSGSAE